MRRVFEGVVVSNKMDKTAIVRVERIFGHPRFNKTVRAYQKHKVHDPENKCKTGDLVLIQETRPLSKDKRWKIEKIIGFKKVIAKQFPGRLHEITPEQEQEKENDTGSV